MDHGSGMTATESGPAQARLSEAILKRMVEFSEAEDVAERRPVETDEGQQLWNAARAERMTDN